MEISKETVRKMRKPDLVWAATNRCSHGKLYVEHTACLENVSEWERNFESIGFFDIEASNLKADFGIMLSYCIKEHNGKIYKGLITPQQLRSATQDRSLVKQCVADLQRFTRIVTYYGARYDLPFVRSRALYHGVDFPPLGSLYHTDLYDWVRRKMRLHNNRMQSACELLEIPSKEHRLLGGIWNRALTGDKSALRFILKHNEEDVLSLEELWERLLPFARVTKTSI